MEQLLELEEPQQQVESPAPAATPVPVSKADFERKCFAQMGALLDEANRNQLKPTFVWVATWHLAVIVSACGNPATADILGQLARHMDHIANLEQAQREAAEAKAQGRLPQ